MNYVGKLYGKIGRSTVPLKLTSEDVDNLAAEVEKLRAENEELKSSQASLLNLLADIRAAVGDPHGKLMQDELVQHCRSMSDVLREAHDALDTCRDNSVELLGCWDWKQGPEETRNQQEYSRLQQEINAADAVMAKLKLFLS